jgi:catechol 2,3-dioxygenase-like lactoylglutathione lyase family enzyme
VATVHHSAIVTRDVEASLVFWRDGLGFDVLMDETFEGPWPSADLDEILPRLDALGVGGQPTVAAVGPVRLAVVHDPNGVRVELMDIAARSNLAAMSGARDE